MNTCVYIYVYAGIKDDMDFTAINVCPYKIHESTCKHMQKFGISASGACALIYIQREIYMDGNNACAHICTNLDVKGKHVFL